jgi:hypothetical protein
MVVSSVAYYYLPINNPQVKVSCSMDEYIVLARYGSQHF